MRNKIIVFIGLIGFTLLLLELPRQYYKMMDNNLFLYEGTDYYDSIETSIVSDLNLKIESFFRSNANLATNRIGYANILSEEETNQVMEKISSELKIITGPNEKSAFSEYVFSEEALSYVTKRCFTAQILYRRANEQYVWELGYLDLFSKYNNPFATIVYDTDTYKIIFMAWGIDKYNLQKYQWISNSNKGPFVKEYYDGISDDISSSFIDDGLGGHFYPVSMSFVKVDTSTLYSDLKELARGFWYFTFQKEYSVMYIEDRY